MSPNPPWIAKGLSAAAEYVASFLDDQQRSLDRFVPTIDSELTFSPGSFDPVWEAVEPMFV